MVTGVFDGMLSMSSPIDALLMLWRMRSSSEGCSDELFGVSISVVDDGNVVDWISREGRIDRASEERVW